MSTSCFFSQERQQGKNSIDNFFNNVSKKEFGRSSNNYLGLSILCLEWAQMKNNSDYPKYINKAIIFSVSSISWIFLL